MSSYDEKNGGHTKHSYGGPRYSDHPHHPFNSEGNHHSVVSYSESHRQERYERKSESVVEFSQAMETNHGHTFPIRQLFGGLNNRPRVPWARDRPEKFEVVEFTPNDHDYGTDYGHGKYQKHNSFNSENPNEHNPGMHKPNTYNVPISSPRKGTYHETSNNRPLVSSPKKPENNTGKARLSPERNNKPDHEKLKPINTSFNRPEYLKPKPYQPEHSAYDQHGNGKPKSGPVPVPQPISTAQYTKSERPEYRPEYERPKSPVQYTKHDRSEYERPKSPARYTTYNRPEYEKPKSPAKYTSYDRPEYERPKSPARYTTYDRPEYEKPKSPAKYTTHDKPEYEKPESPVKYTTYDRPEYEKPKSPVKYTTYNRPEYERPKSPAAAEKKSQYQRAEYGRQEYEKPGNVKPKLQYNAPGPNQARKDQEHVEIIDSSEAARRYRDVQPRPNAEQKYAGTIDAREAVRKYNGVFVAG